MRVLQKIYACIIWIAGPPSFCFDPPTTNPHATPLVTTMTRNAAAANPVPWAYQSDGSIIFNVDCAVQGDVLLRIRHLATGGQKVGWGVYFYVCIYMWARRPT